ncbi:MAG TPA: hypothetical protein VJV79_28165 [Polyangiaceae bacterium]|nr:hypothetical protein [Polyangiaceae bacterium]
MSARTSLPLCVPLLAALCGAGCDDSLKSVSLIEETRVLGARVEVEEDPLRSSPRPGERASLRFFVAAPDGKPQLSYALSLCTVRLTNNGFPPCADAPFASSVRADASDADARLDFQLPLGVDLETTPHAFASGLICPDSGLILGSDGAPSCLTGTGTEVAFEFDLVGNNHNPSLEGHALLLDGEPWPASAEMTCDDGSLRQVTASSRHALRIDLADSNFEPLTRQSSVEPGRESLLVSPFSSAGELDHGFVMVSADTPPDQRRVGWDAPRPANALPNLVRFYFVVRDTRGGEDFAQRALCVVP